MNEAIDRFGSVVSVNDGGVAGRGRCADALALTEHGRRIRAVLIERRMAVPLPLGSLAFTREIARREGLPAARR